MLRKPREANSQGACGWPRAVLFAGTAAIAAVALAPQGAWAQPAISRDGDAPAQSSGLDEILVTAQRREERVQSVPIAVSVFSQAELDARNVVRALDVLQYVPNVVAHNNVGLGTANSYYIRGLGSTDSIATADPAVGTYVDDIYIGRQSANNVSLFDVERVEVLRGPQGTLFGRNTTGGAVSILLARPGPDLEGFVEGGVGRFDRVALRGGVNLPVSDRLAVRVTGYWNRDDGYVRNVTTGERLNNAESWGVRGALSAQLDERVSWNASAFYTDTSAANIINFDCDPANPANCDGRFVTTGLLADNRGADQLAPLVIANGKGRLPLGSDTRTFLAASNLGIDFGRVQLAFISGWVRIEQDYLIDFFDGRAAPTLAFAADPVTGLPTRFNVSGNVNLFPAVRGFSTGGFVIANLAKTDQFTQELKLTGSFADDRVKWVAGIFYFNERSTTDFSDSLTPASGVPLLLADRTVRNRTEAIAGYAQLDWEFVPRWTATAGIRYTDEKRSTRFFDNRPFCQARPLPPNCISTPNFKNVDIDLNPSTPPVDIPLDQQVAIWTPRFVLNYAPTDDVLLFASATRGFKSGAQAARATQVRQLLPVGPEKVWSYELGAKTEWLDRRLRVNVTAFQQDTEDFQGGTGFVNPQTGALTFVTRNLAGLRNRGVEIEAVARPVPPLTLTVAAGFQNMKYVVDSNQPAVDGFGFLSPLAQQAECQAALAGQPSPLGFPGTAVARAQGNCSGIVTNTGDFAKPVRAPDATVAASAAWRFELPGIASSLTPTIHILHTGDQEVGTNNLSGFLSSGGVANFAGDGAFVLGSFSKAHTMLNLNLRLAADSERWALTLSCTNCNDVAVPQSTLSNFSYLNPPRSWALDLRVRF